MEYRAEFAITLPEDLLDALGIDEDTLFEAYYDDGKIKVRILDEEALEDEFEDDDGTLMTKISMSPRNVPSVRTSAGIAVYVPLMSKGV